MRLIQRYSVWLVSPLGAAMSLAFAPFNLWPLAIICPALLFLAWREAAPKRAALLGFLFTFGLFVAGTSWLCTIAMVPKRGSCLLPSDVAGRLDAHRVVAGLAFFRISVARARLRGNRHAACRIRASTRCVWTHLGAHTARRIA